jgi:hypothetical protein
MKIKLYFDVRFLYSEDDHERVDQKGMYVHAFSGDFCFSFSRTVSLPCLPVRNQLYHLAFDPILLQSNADGDDTHYYVRESGFIEEGDTASPYFVISDDRSFKDWLKDYYPDQLMPVSKKQYQEWKSIAEDEERRSIEIFKKHGWKVESKD